ncbi:MAG TPA: DUF4097 family beta strand repeat-containing protein [Candidatus Limnocylindrales bacterium]
MSERKVWLLLAGLFTVVVIGATFTVAWVLLRPQGPAETRLERASLAQPLERLDFIDFEASEISVTAAPVTATEIVRELRWTGSVPQYTESWEGGMLRIRHNCGDSDDDVCSIGYRVRVPEGVEVRASTSSGDVRITGTTAPVTVRTVSGGVDLTGVTGKLTVETVSGSVSASGLTVKEATVMATSGDIELGFAAAPDALTLRSTSGDTTVRLPAAERSPFRVSVRTVSGSQQVGVDRSQSAARFIDAESTSGDVKIGY